MALLPLANSRPGGFPSFWRRFHLLEHRFGFFPRIVSPEYLVKVLPQIRAERRFRGSVHNRNLNRILGSFPDVGRGLGVVTGTVRGLFRLRIRVVECSSASWFCPTGKL